MSIHSQISEAFKKNAPFDKEKFEKAVIFVESVGYPILCCGWDGKIFDVAFNILKKDMKFVNCILMENHVSVMTFNSSSEKEDFEHFTYENVASNVRRLIKVN
jgi:CO dehydrogenase/acetyl-CoA synthase gamma subunit (corrinoid Fe-S protein)